MNEYKTNPEDAYALKVENASNFRNQNTSYKTLDQLRTGNGLDRHSIGRSSISQELVHRHFSWIRTVCSPALQDGCATTTSVEQMSCQA